MTTPPTTPNPTPTPSEFWLTYLPGSGSSSAFVSFTDPGTTVIGTVVALRTMTFAGDSAPTPLVDLRLDDGAEVTIAAGASRLRSGLAEAAPGPGDRIRVIFEGWDETSANRPFKLFRVSVQRAPAPPAPSVSGYDPDDAPF